MMRASSQSAKTLVLALVMGALVVLAAPRAWAETPYFASDGNQFSSSFSRDAYNSGVADVRGMSMSMMSGAFDRGMGAIMHPADAIQMGLRDAPEGDWYVDYLIGIWSRFNYMPHRQECPNLYGAEFEVPFGK